MLLMLFGTMSRLLSPRPGPGFLGVGLALPQQLDMRLLKLARTAEEVGDQVELLGAIAGEQLLLALGDQRPDQLPGSAGGGLRRAPDHLAAVARVGGAGDVASLFEAVEHAGDT